MEQEMDIELSIPEVAEPTPKGGEPEPKQTETISVEDHKSLLKRFERLERDYAEVKESEKAWADRAMSATRPQAPAQTEEPDPIDTLTADDAVDILSKEGLKGLKSRGFLTQREVTKLLAEREGSMAEKVREMVDRGIQGFIAQATKQTSLLQEYPDLGKADSDFAKAAKANFARLVEEEPSLKDTPQIAWKLAAKEADLDAKAARPTRTEERMDRIRRQAPESIRRGGNEMEMPDEQTAAFLNGLGVSVDAFNKTKASMGGKR